MKKLFTILFLLIVSSVSSDLLAQTAYWKDGFEDTRFPSGSSSTLTATEVQDTNGVWILYCTYRTSSSSGLPIGTYDIRIAKPTTTGIPAGTFAYLVTPKVTEGVGKVTFYEGRSGKLVTIEKSSDEGKTWIFVDTVRTIKDSQTNPQYNTVNVNDNKANRIRFSNQWTSDCDIDEVTLYKYSGGNSVNNNKTFPIEFKLDQNYPNPFNPSTNISFSLPVGSNIKIAVYNTIGQEIAVLREGFLPAGYHEVSFKGNNLPTGIYVYRLIMPGQILSKKMVLNK
jgi:hypothetical protein